MYIYINVRKVQIFKQMTQFSNTTKGSQIILMLTHSTLQTLMMLLLLFFLSVQKQFIDMNIFLLL